jgi:hypothetical protein
LAATRPDRRIASCRRFDSQKHYPEKSLTFPNDDAADQNVRSQTRFNPNLARRQYHHHLTAFELGFLLDLGQR